MSTPTAAYCSIKGRCPACGQGKLYKSLLTMHDACPNCGQAFTGKEQGDGPGHAAILIIGALSAIGASVLDIKMQPPFWVHAAIWIPFTILGSLACIRYFKAWFVVMQYQHHQKQ